KRVELRRDPDSNGRGLVRIPGGTIRRPCCADTRWVALRVQARHLRHIARPDAACHPDLKGLSVGFRRPEVPTRTRWQSICTMSVAGLCHLASEYDKITVHNSCGRVGYESNFPAPRPGREGLQSVNFAVIPGR